MYLFILLFSLILFAVIAIILCNGDVMEPLPLSIESFVLVTFIAVMYNKFDGSDISGYTVLYIILSLFVYALGYILTKGLLQKITVNTYHPPQRYPRIPKKRITFGFLLVSFFVLALSFKNTLSIAQQITPNATPLNMLLYARNAYLFTDYDRNFVVSISSFFVMALGYFYTYILAQEFTKIGKRNFHLLKKYKLELLVIIVSLLSSALGTGRTFLIKYIVFLVVVFYYSYFFKNKIRRFSFKQVASIVKKMVLALTVFFLFFQLLGMLTEKTDKLSVVDMLYAYSGASVLAFDRSIDIYQYDGRFWGEECFYGLYGFLNTIGIEVPNRILHLPFVDVGGGNSTNIFTSLRGYLYDFGFSGMFIVQFLLGVISSVMYTLLKRLGINSIYIIIYAILIYGTVMQGIQEITLRNFMSITNLFLIAFFSVLCLMSQIKIKIR